MKRLSLILLLPIAAALIIGCASAQPAAAPAPATQADPTLPPWINDRQPEGVIWGIGQARQSSDNLSMQMAEARARVAIANTIDTSVQAMIIDYNRDAGTPENQVSLSMQESVSRNLSQAQLRGAFVDQRWRAPDGTWWVRVEFNKADARNMLADIFESEAGLYANFRAQEALRMMDDQLSRTSGSSPAVVSN